MRKFISAEEAIDLLPKGECIHTFYNESFGLIGADWDRDDLIEKIKTSDKIELTGETARSMNHGIAVYNNDTKWHSDILFVETDKDKLEKFDPEEVKTGKGE